MQSISTKELRENLPAIRMELDKGESFLIIHQSRPIAHLSPFSNFSDYIEATDKDIELASLQDIDEDDYLTDEEVKYYLSLP